MIVESEPMKEVIPESLNAELEISVTESGRVRVVRQLQLRKVQSGIVVNCEGASNLKDVNLEHPSNRELPRVETAEGTVNEVRRPQLENAPDSILRTLAGDSKTTFTNWEHPEKQ
jgi:hypothetical protein